MRESARFLFHESKSTSRGEARGNRIAWGELESSPTHLYQGWYTTRYMIYILHIIKQEKLMLFNYPQYILPWTFKEIINVPFKALISLGLPHQPKFEGIVFAATLYGLVSCVIRNIVELVLLEQVGSIGRVARWKEILSTQND